MEDRCILKVHQGGGRYRVFIFDQASIPVVVKGLYQLAHENEPGFAWSHVAELCAQVRRFQQHLPRWNVSATI